MDLFDLAARITLDSSGYDKGLEEASEKTSSFGSKLKNGVGKAAKIGATAVAAFGAVTAGIATAVLKGTSAVAEHGDNIDKMSQKLGISATAYQEWDAVMQHSGTSIDAMSRGMQTLQKNAVNSADKFAKLGITEKQLASMSTEELFSATITGLQNMGEGAERTALANELLGGSAKELGALLNTSAEDTQAMKDRVHELGGVMSDEAVKAAAQFQDSMQDMQTAFGGLKNNLMAEFLPSITTVMDGLTELFSGGSTEKITEGIGQLTNKITEILPRVLEIATDIIIKLGEALIENAPMLFRTAASLMMTLGQAIIDNLPMLVSVALQIIVELANSIAKALPTLVPTIVDVVLKIVEILTDPDTLSALIDAAIAIIIGLADGLIEALPRLIEKVPVIIENLVVALVRNAPKLVVAAFQLMASLGNGILSSLGSIGKVAGELFKTIAAGIGNAIKAAFNWGKDLIKNFINGIKNMFGNVKSAFSSLGNIIKRMIGFSEPDEGPLSNFHTYAPDMMKLFAEGVKQNEGLITDAVESAFDIRPEITRSVNLNNGEQELVVPRVGAAGNGGSGTQTAILEIDRTAFAKLIFKLNNEESGRVGVKLAGVNV